MGQLCCRMMDGDQPCDEVDGMTEADGPTDQPRSRGGEQLEQLLKELFRLHDLNGNGLLEMEELVQLNSKVAMLHYGKDTDLMEVKTRYRELFKQRLDAQGRPVKYDRFRTYVLEVLNSMDPDPLAQEMILEQFAAEARSARAVFHLPSFSSNADQNFLPHLSFHANSFMGRGSSPKKGISFDEPVPVLRPRRACIQRACMGGA
eukprot:TRINITY_DN76155_c0_g1_i1.p1 TRINITY_DN76155_c0_g1~~TRINITY_DN76155_c0_g1_i1.p1  ORF type:complete len:204 (+),score=47.04 TRINITY_DN76155_c0_g1_i1:124-735(+)